MQNSIIALLIFSFIACGATSGIHNPPPMPPSNNDTIPTGFPQQKWAGWVQSNKQVMADSGFLTLFGDSLAKPSYPLSALKMLSYTHSPWYWDGTKYVRVANSSELYTLPKGLNGQLPFYNLDSSNTTTAADVLNVGKFVYNDAQLDSMKTSRAAQIDIFNRWKRFAHGGRGGEGNEGVQAMSDTIPDRTDATNSFEYDAVNNLVKSTFNTGSNIGFFNTIFSTSYSISATISAEASGSDNDRIGIVIAFMEDANDMVRNNAYGLNPDDFSWPINVTDSLIPNQHSLIVYRNRENTGRQYYVMYDNRLPTMDTIYNGTSLLSYTPTSIWDGSNTEADISVERNGDTIRIYTTEYADAPGGKGDLGHEITFLLTDSPELEKFRNGSYFGVVAQSQAEAYWENLYFSDNSLNIYDLRNGDVWTYDREMYSIDPSLDVFTDIGIRRLWYNPYIPTFGYINPDSSYYVIQSPSSVSGGQNIMNADLTADASHTQNLGTYSQTWNSEFGSFTATKYFSAVGDYTMITNDSSIGSVSITPNGDYLSAIVGVGHIDGDLSSALKILSPYEVYMSSGRLSGDEYLLGSSSVSGAFFRNKFTSEQYSFPLTFPTSPGQTLSTVDNGDGTWSSVWATPSGGGSSAYSTLTYSATPTIDYNDGQKRVITLTGDATLSYDNFPNGGEVILYVIQDGTGGRTLTFPAGTVFPTGTATGLVANLSTAAGAQDKISITYNNITGNYEVEIAKAYQ